MTIPDYVFFFGMYAVINGCTFLVYALDKWRAKNNAWRIPEGALLLLALIGPFGAYGAMRMFRHKTQKMKFLLVPVFLVLHLAGIIWVLSCLIGSL
jgi:uncharacterized membrane protein YsdA (DUF1294 family)